MKTITRISTLVLISLSVLFSCKTPIEPDPIANFSAVLNQNGLVEFKNNSSNFSTFSWEFGDGGTGANTLYHTYQDNGTYSVTLYAVSLSGKTSKYAANVTVNNVRGSACFYLSYAFTSNIEVIFGGKTLTMNGYYKSGVPTCGDQYTATFNDILAGDYIYYVREVGSSKYVQGNIHINRGCNVKRI